MPADMKNSKLGRHKKAVKRISSCQLLRFTALSTTHIFLKINMPIHADKLRQTPKTISSRKTSLDVIQPLLHLFMVFLDGLSFLLFADGVVSQLVVFTGAECRLYS